MAKAKTAADTKAKPKKRTAPVAPKSHTVIVYRGNDRYGGFDVNFYRDTKAAQKLSDSDAKEMAITLLRGQKLSNRRPTGTRIGASCASGVKSALGLSPKAGRVYRVKMTYEVEDITEQQFKQATTLANKLQNAIDGVIKPAAKAKSKAKKATKSKSKGKAQPRIREIRPV